MPKRLKYYCYILLFAVLIGFNIYPVKAQTFDSIKFYSLIDEARKYNRDFRNKNKCEEILSEALQIALADSNYTALALSYNNYGILYRNVAEYSLAIDYHTRAIHFSQKANNLPLLASSYNNLGVVYRRIDDHPKATQFHLLGLKTAEKINDNPNRSISYNSLGNIYSLNGQYSIALSYFQKALSLAKEMDNSLGQAMNYNNIGEVFEFSSQYDSAMYYYSKSLEINQKINSLKGLGISYNAIGKIHLFQGRTNEALKLFNKALEIDIDLGDKKFIADSYINLGKAYSALNKLDNAEYNTRKGLELASNIGSISHTQWAYENLAEIYTKRSLYEQALKYNNLATKFKDSLLNEKNSRIIALMEVIYNTEKREQEIQILRQTQEINTKEIARQKARRDFYFVGFILALLLLTAVLVAFSFMRRANRLLAHQKQEIEKSHKTLFLQKEEIVLQKQEIENQRSSIEQKNNKLIDAYRVIEGYVGKITDSIRYAQRIQKAILPDLSQLKPFFSDFFVYYKPKDFVSGDFYWLTIKDKSLYFAVADCTGHGVPGAFMSIIGMDLLNQAVNQLNIIEPADVLNYLNLELRNKLKKEDEEDLILKDSMDIAFLSVTKDERTISYSGALMPLAVVRGGSIIEHKPHFMSIGTSPKLLKSQFVQKNIEVKEGDWLYLYSDGFMDQLGGLEKRRFMRSNLFRSLQTMGKLTGESQKKQLSNIFNEWKGNNEQLDDVVIIGLKV